MGLNEYTCSIGFDRTSLSALYCLVENVCLERTILRVYTAPDRHTSILLVYTARPDIKVHDKHRN
jgi:hypothetical protein